MMMRGVMMVMVLMAIAVVVFYCGGPLAGDEHRRRRRRRRLCSSALSHPTGDARMKEDRGGRWHYRYHYWSIVVFHGRDRP
jgi:hypothetical protein